MPEAPEPQRLVFVYGTLRRGECNDIARYTPASVCLGAGEADGALYDLGPYPGAIFGGEGRIHGEVYRVLAAVEAQLDALEGVQADGEGEYRRREVQVRTRTGPLVCLSYEIHPSRLAGARRIVDGDWVRRVPPELDSALRNQDGTS